MCIWNKELLFWCQINSFADWFFSLQNAFLCSNSSLLAADFGSCYLISKFISCCSVLKLIHLKKSVEKLWGMLLSSKTQIHMAKLKTRCSCVMSLLSKCHFFGGYMFRNSAGHNRCKEADTKRMLNKRKYACTCCVLGRGTPWSWGELG